MVMAFAAASRPPPAITPALPPPSIPRLILLDRDGVVNEDVGAPGVIDPRRQLQLTSNAGRALGRLRRRGCHVSLITNQSCVGKGIISERELDDIHKKLGEMLLEEDGDAVLDNVYICTSTREDDDRRMKPGPGMIEEAKHDFGNRNQNEFSCVFIGDTLTDMMAAMAGGVGLRVLVETGYGRVLMGRNAGKIPSVITELTDEMNADLAQVLPFVYVENMACAVDWLLGDGDAALF